MKTAKNIKPMYAQHLGAGIFAAGWLCDECHTNSVIFDYDTGHYKCENPDCGWTGEKSYYPSDDDDSKDFRILYKSKKALAEIINEK